MSQALDILWGLLSTIIVVSLLLLTTYALHVPHVHIPRPVVRVAQAVVVWVPMIAAAASLNRALVNECAQFLALRERSHEASGLANWRLAEFNERLLSYYETMRDLALSECTVSTLHVASLFAFSAGAGFGATKLQVAASPRWLAGIAVGFVGVFGVWLMITEVMLWPLVAGAAFIVGFAVSSAVSRRSVSEASAGSTGSVE